MVGLGPAKRARRVLRPRFAREGKDDPTTRVDAGVVVVREVGRADAIAHEEQLSRRRAVGRDRERGELRAEIEMLRRGGEDVERVRGAETRGPHGTPSGPGGPRRETRAPPGVPTQNFENSPLFTASSYLSSAASGIRSRYVWIGSSAPPRMKPSRYGSVSPTLRRTSA